MLNFLRTKPISSMTHCMTGPLFCVEFCIPPLTYFKHCRKSVNNSNNLNLYLCYQMVKLYVSKILLQQFYYKLIKNRFEKKYKLLFLTGIYYEAMDGWGQSPNYYHGDFDLNSAVNVLFSLESRADDPNEKALFSRRVGQQILLRRHLFLNMTGDTF